MDEDEDDENDYEEAQGDTGEDLVSLPDGETLSIEEADRLLRKHSANVIAIVGERESGKTTLICTIYDRFLRGPFADQAFAGSQTLVGLERRLHFSRVESGNAEADTPRTSRQEGLSFFHFSMSSLSDLERQRHLLVSDRAGEVYREARGDTATIADLVEVHKAQIVAILLNGASIVNPAERSVAMQAVRQLIRAFLDAGAIGHATSVQVITTKLDLINSSPNATQLKQLLESFKQRLSEEFSSRLGTLTCFDIAARSLGGELPLGFGVDSVLKTWITPNSPNPFQYTSPTDLRTEFHLLLQRTDWES